MYSSAWKQNSKQSQNNIHVGNVLMHSRISHDPHQRGRCVWVCSFLLSLILKSHILLSPPPFTLRFLPHLLLFFACVSFSFLILNSSLLPFLVATPFFPFCIFVHLFYFLFLCLSPFLLPPSLASIYAPVWFPFRRRSSSGSVSICLLNVLW